MNDSTTLPDTANDVSYDADFHAWAMDQGRRLRAGLAGELDVLNLAEEIESLGRGEKRELTNRLVVVLTHLLKWSCQPGLRGRSWLASIQEQRDQAASVLRDSPSLRPRLPEVVTEAYRRARRMAISETHLADSTFPQTCPWSIEQVLDETFLPEEGD